MKLAGATDLARASLAAAQEAQETAANRHYQTAERFRVGDLVYLRTKNLNFGRPSKKLDWSPWSAVTPSNSTFKAMLALHDGPMTTLCLDKLSQWKIPAR